MIQPFLRLIEPFYNNLHDISCWEQPQQIFSRLQHSLCAVNIFLTTSKEEFSPLSTALRNGE